MPPLAIDVPSFRKQDGDVTFINGMNSIADPAQLGPATYPRSMNTLNRGGIVQCRPGYRCRSVLPQGNFQGAALFSPKRGLPVIIFAVEGFVYKAESPFRNYVQIPDIQFLPEARQLYFQQAEQSVQINEDGSLTHIAPRDVLVIQDGAFTAPAVFDGTTAEHQYGSNLIPLGGPMAWVGDRLWVARDSNLFASDLANPLSFIEPQYVTTISAFTLPGTITALARTPSVEFPSLLVFTETTTTSIQASIRDRSQWLTTPNFQYVLFPNIGCVSERSVTTHYGLLWWYSQYGLTSLDSALASKQTSLLPYRDNEMIESKALLSDDLSLIAAHPVENYLLVSVPYADRHNRHTWVLDNSAYQTLNESARPVWNSFWTGTRPAVWLTVNISGTDQVFHFSRDFDGQNRLWESFTPDRLDDGCPITWWMESRGYVSGNPIGPKQFRWADVFFSELSGTVDVAIFWASCTRGKYRRILTKRIQANAGTVRYEDELTATTQMFALKKQSRRLRTQDAREIYDAEDQTSCGVESDDAEFISESFQLLIVGSGPGAVRMIQTFCDPQEGESLSAECPEDEVDIREVRFDGASDSGNDFEALVAALSDTDTVFTANRSESVTVDGETGVGVGSSESVISQNNADNVATIIARHRASVEVASLLPDAISLGRT